MIKIYHNGECSKCRGALEIMQEKNIPYEARWYMAEPLSRNELKDILQKLRLKAFDLVRQNEELYQSRFTGKNFTEDEWIDILITNPSLMQRPIVVNGSKAIIARPPEKLFEVL
jgi:arsenate reductase